VLLRELPGPFAARSADRTRRAARERGGSCRRGSRTRVRAAGSLAHRSPSWSGAGRGDRADLLAAGRDRDVGPCERVLVELARCVRARVNSDFLQRFEDRRMDRVAGFAAGGARMVPAGGCVLPREKQRPPRGRSL